MYQVVEDFPHLVVGTDIGTDADFDDVVLLAGFDGSIVDESNVGRTLTAAGDAAASATDPLVGAGSLVSDGVGDWVTAADADDLSFAGDFAMEFYYAGPGSAPSGDSYMVTRWQVTSNRREWAIFFEQDANRIDFFVSTTGANFLNGFFDLDAADVTAAAFFNGGKRNIMLRRNGGEVAIYVNGVKGSGTQDLGATALNSGSSSLAIGARSQATPDFVTPGKYDEVRITNGAARQTADKFTPTGRAFPRSGP